MSIQNLIKEGIDLFKNKKFDEAITKLSQALEKIENKDSHIQEQNDIQFWLGHCYFEQAKKAKGRNAEQLFGLAIKHLQQQLRLAKQLEGENGIQEQINAQHWLGRCYFEQAMKAEEEASTRLFEQAIEHHQQQLRLAEQLEGESGIQGQIYAQSWLGGCYLEQAIKAKGEASTRLFEQAIEHHQQQLRLAEQLEGENGIQEQINAQHWLGRCYLEQAMRAEEEASEHLFELAIKRHQQQLRLAKQLEDKQNSIQKQINAQSWLGRCYFEQAMKAERKASEKLFGQAVEHNQERLRLAEQLEGENGIQEQIYAQSWLGRCYFEQAMKAEGEASKKLFEQAIEHHQQQLRLAKQLEGKNGIQEQIYAQHWLGRCYLEQAMKAEGEASKKLFEQAIEHHQQQLRLAKQLEGENGIQEQIYAEAWLGRCYFEQAMKAKGKASEKLFGQAVEHNQERLRFAKQLKGKNGIQKQIYAQHWLGRCYLEQAMKAKGKDVERLSGQAVEHYQSQLRLIEELTDEQGRLRQQNYAQSWLGYCYFRLAIKAEKEAAAELSEQDNKSFQKQPEFSKHLPPLTQEEWERYFEWKKQGIQNKLFKDNKENKNDKENLTSAISTILAVLNIPPIELDSTPLAHYTSPSVCEKLFGIVHDKNDANNKDKDPVDKQQASPMRISSSTYMNDPTEGEGLLDLLNLQDLELKNKADCPEYNAFFACFSSRVNDLNQFRLYGKENGVEASGCCLVFNKDGNWLREPDVSFSFRSMAEKGDEYSREQPVEADISDEDLEDANLPLYQVAYIAYQDEYLAEDKCSIWLSRNKQKFGIHLEPVGENPGWHQLRINKLEEALMKLIEKSNEINKEDRKALEYIRYLFKDFAFRDEEEFRLLKIEKIGSDKIEYCETTQSIYLPYADARDIVDEVILGTNYEKSGKGRKAEAFQHLMRKHYPNVKVSRSSLPINANPPIKKD